MRTIPTLVLLAAMSASAFSQRMPQGWYRARAAIENGHAAGAISILDSAIGANPVNHSLFLLRGQASLARRDYTSALSDFFITDSLRPGSASLWIARTYSQTNNIPKAIEYLKQHLSLPEKESEASLKLDPLLNGIKESPLWQNLWLTDWYSPQERLVAQVEYLFTRKQWDEAIDLLNQQLRGRRGRHQLIALRGQAYYMTGSYRAALADFADALRRNRRNHTYMAWKAKTLTELKRPRQAHELLNRAIQQSGGEPHHFLLRAKVFASELKFMQAAEDVEYFLGFYPSNPEAIELFATYAQQAGRLMEALRYLGRLISAYPQESSFYYRRASIYIISKNWAFAEPDLLQATTLDPNHADALLQLGITQLNLGKAKEACSAFQRAKERGSFSAQEWLYLRCRR